MSSKSSSGSLSIVLVRLLPMSPHFNTCHAGSIVCSNTYLEPLVPAGVLSLASAVDSEPFFWMPCEQTPEDPFFQKKQSLVHLACAKVGCPIVLMSDWTKELQGRATCGQLPQADSDRVFPLTFMIVAARLDREIPSTPLLNLFHFPRH